jgi:hypothetical protein
MIPIVLQMNGTLVLQRVEHEKKARYCHFGFSSREQSRWGAEFCKNPLEGAMVASCVLDFLLLAQRYRPQDYRVPGQFGFPKEGSCEGFVKIGKAPVRLTHIIPGREGFLEAARLYKEVRCSSESR